MFTVDNEITWCEREEEIEMFGDGFLIAGSNEYLPDDIISDDYFSDTIHHTFVAKSIKSISGESIPQGYFQSRSAGKGHSLSIRFALLFFCFYHRSNSASPPNPHFTVFCFQSSRNNKTLHPSFGYFDDGYACELMELYEFLYGFDEFGINDY
jgi:hypothetical protein